ncbi:MAG TPA: aminotransferase class I/II-fold pyridoxal phosphate-dependent enzyme [Phycisphaerae bacterium]|nr:aminotransferase class I/II-fold pyridoxal phosphate-dependent enzyme [Phycisphaerae bacterium]HRY68720.1 aminotransferase class I/II-fold pyridoxal phosphate-dependent enzyme [Phycisphaerae bacterium]HSA29537.1 aminotransferase class I/II-fold pyridoxal phosphate-dependent enzyme [Phycisphaerae bacterium]
MTRKKTASTRRAFLSKTGLAAAGLTLAQSSPASAASTEKPALLGGDKAVTARTQGADTWPLYGEAEEKVVLQMLRHPTYGPNDELENDWKAYYNVPYAKTYCNGTSALAAMFFALDLPPGSEIMVPSYTFFATIVPMRLFGLVPVFVDINPRTLNMDLEDARRRLTKGTRAILPVHWFGNPADMDGFCDFAKEKGLIVLEDCAHAHGTSLKGKLMGTWGEMSIFSFQTTKPLPGIEGGMGMYRDRSSYERAVSFGHYDVPKTFGQDSAYARYEGTGLGLKLRMHPVAAVLIRAQFPKLRERNVSGVQQVRSLNDRLLQLPGLYDQRARPDAQRLYYDANVLFVEEAEAGISRDRLVQALRAEGVAASRFVYRLQHKCALYAEEKWWHHKPAIPELPGSEKANATAIWLPYFTRPVPEVVEQYVKAFEKIWAHRKQLA